MASFAQSVILAPLEAKRAGSGIDCIKTYHCVVFVVLSEETGELEMW